MHLNEVVDNERDKLHFLLVRQSVPLVAGATGNLKICFRIAVCRQLGQSMVKRCAGKKRSGKG